MVLVYAGLVALRLPRIVLEGRFWAEEGTIFFFNAWTMKPATALLTPYGGYLNLVATASGLAARWGATLEWAPYVTIGIAGLFQLCPLVLLLLARDRWLADWRVRGGAALLLITVPAADEIWLQTLHCQFELTLCAGILLALAVPRDWSRWLALLLLLLAPLCGPGAIALLPLFGLRAALERSGGRALQAGALALGSAVQLLLFFTPSERAIAFDPAVLLSLVAVKHLAIPFLGIGEARAIAARLRGALASGQVPLLAVTASLAAAGGLALAIVLARAWTALWLLAGAAMVAACAYVGALDGAPALIDEFAGERYAFVPQSLLALCLLALAASAGGATRWVAAGLCVWLFFAGERQFRHPWKQMDHGPDWRAQVALWRADPRHALELWPPPWRVRLEVTAPAVDTNKASR